MKRIDCRGMVCPAPVIATKKGLEQEPSGICILVDDGAPRENVKRFASNRGYKVTEKPDTDGWSLLITVAADMVSPPVRARSTGGEQVLFITSDKLGNGPDQLGLLLMKNFLFTLLETDRQPDKVLLLNSGVLLAVQDADTVEALQGLERVGTEIFSCGVCLDYFNKKDQLAVGKVTNMLSTAESLFAADTVIRL